MPKTEYMAIEFLIRKGMKQIELLNMPQTGGVHQHQHQHHHHVEGSGCCDHHH